MKRLLTLILGIALLGGAIDFLFAEKTPTAQDSCQVSELNQADVVVAFEIVAMETDATTTDFVRLSPMELPSVSIPEAITDYAEVFADSLPNAWQTYLSNKHSSYNLLLKAESTNTSPGNFALRDPVNPYLENLSKQATNLG